MTILSFVRLQGRAVAGSFACCHEQCLPRQRYARCGNCRRGKPNRGKLVAFGDPIFSIDDQTKDDGKDETVKVCKRSQRDARIAFKA